MAVKGWLSLNRVYIDGYNLLFSLEIREGSLEEMREELLSRLREALTNRPGDFTIVFDAARGTSFSSGHLGTLEIVFTEPGMSADDYLLREFASSPHARSSLLVTSDRKLAKEAQWLGVKVVDARLFWQKMARWSCQEREASPSKDGPAPPHKRKVRPLPDAMERERWLKIFTERLKGKSKG